MNKLNKYIAYTGLVTILLCGETLSPLQLVALIIFTAGMLWLAGEFNVHHKAQKFHSQLLSGAPIAQQTARDLKIEV